MTIFKNELKQGRASLIIWTSSIAFLIVACILIFPDTKSQMGDVGDIFSSMGSFSAAFGMDKLNFGEFIGFYGVECGSILGLGGAFFAAMTAISALSKEESGRTAEFLLSHPVSRVRIITEKLLSVIAEILIMNVIVFLISALSAAAIGEDPLSRKMLLLHIAYLIMQLEIAFICFGVSSFIRRGSIGTGLGIAVIAYFLNLISNISDSADFLKYITPFGYTDASDIFPDSTLDGILILIGIIISAIGVTIAYMKYTKKDIHS